MTRARRRGSSAAPDDEAAAAPTASSRMAGLLGQIALAAFQSLAVRRPPPRRSPAPFAADARRSPPPARSRVVAWACGAARRRPRWRTVLDALALAARRALHRPRARGRRADRALAAEALALAELARRARRPLAAWAAVAFAALGARARARHARAADALLDGLDAPARRRRRAGSPSPARCSRVSRAPLGVTGRGASCAPAPRSSLLYLASVEVVTLAGPAHTGPDAAQRAVGASPASAR